MPAKRPDRRKPARAPAKRAKRPTVQTLARRLARQATEQAAERDRQTRRLATLRRAHDRRVAALVQEIASLRHHEARTAALTRLVAERDRTLAVQATRIAELESLVQGRTHLG